VSIYTTITVTREHAIRMLHEHAGTFGHLTNKELEDLLDATFKDTTLNNYLIEGPEIMAVPKAPREIERCPCCGYPECGHPHDDGLKPK